MSTQHPAVLMRRADDLVAQRRPAEALDVLAPLLSDEPDSRSVLELAGRAYFYRAQLDHAERAFSRLVELDPTDAYARFALGRVCERRSRVTEAVSHYRVAVALNPRPEYAQGLARLQEQVEGEQP
ncbi:MAG: tetratricopeptide repeat protein [Jiangellales bacterium]